MMQGDNGIKTGVYPVRFSSWL